MNFVLQGALKWDVPYGCRRIWRVFMFDRKE